MSVCVRCRSISPNRISPNLILPNRSPSWVYCRAPIEIELSVRVRVRVRVRVSIRREMRLGEMRRHPSYTYLRSAKNGTEKMMNDKTKLVKEAKNDKASRRCWSTYQKRLGKMRLGEMRLGGMLPNRLLRLSAAGVPRCVQHDHRSRPLGAVSTRSSH